MGDAWTVDDPVLQDKLVRFASKLCPAGYGSDSCDEVVAECNRRLVEKGTWPDGQPRTFVVSYLWQMVTNVWREVRRQPDFFPLQSERDDEVGREVPSPGPTPERAAEAAELGRAIRGCLQGMTDTYRHAVVLHLAGFRHAEIADRMGWPNSKSSENRVLRGLQVLRRCLSAKGFGFHRERR